MLEKDILNTIFIVGLVNLSVWFSVFYVAVITFRMPMYHPFFIVMFYHLLGFVLRPFNIYFLGSCFLWDRIGYFPSTYDMVFICLVANSSFISIFYGVLSKTRLKNNLIQIFRPINIDVAINIYFISTVSILILAGIFATYKSIGGSESVLAYEVVELSSNGARALVGISGYVTAMAEFLPMICIFLFFNRSTRKVSIILILAYIYIRLLAGSQRLSFVIVLAAVFLFYHVTVEKRYPKIIAVVIILLFAFLFEIIGNDRYAFRKITDGSSSVYEVWSEYTLNRGGNALTSDIVEFDVSSAAVSFINENNDFSYGTQYLRLLIWPIPRQVWANKPIFTNIVDLNDYGDFRYLTITQYADAYMVIGFIGLVPLMIVLGKFMGWVYEASRQTTNCYLYMFYWVFLIYVKTIMRDGGVTVFYFWITSMIPLSILIYIGKARVRYKNES